MNQAARKQLEARLARLSVEPSSSSSYRLVQYLVKQIELNNTTNLGSCRLVCTLQRVQESENIKGCRIYGPHNK